MKNKRRVLFFANRLHRNIMLVIFISALVPAAIIGICLYYLIFSIAAWHIGFPEAVASILIPALKQVNFIIMLALPISIILIFTWASMISNRIVGPFDRLIRDLDDIIAGKKTSHIYIRSKDAVAGLIRRINLLIDRLNK